MSELDALPADQRAAVQLLLKQGQSYDQLAGLLGIDPAGVQTRAHAALDTLGPGDDLDAVQRGEVADYLLGQQSASQREATHDLLASSQAAREWAGAVADALRPLAGDALPDIPSAAAPAREQTEPIPREPEPLPRDEPSPDEPFVEEPAAVEEEPAAFDEEPPGFDEEPPPFEEPARERRPRPSREPSEGGPSSRLGGALLLAGIGIVIAVVIVLILSGGDDNDKGSSVSRTAPTQTGTNAQRPVAQINLFSATGNSRQVGLAQVFQQGRRRALIVAGQGLRPGAYALWLYNSESRAKLLGFVPERVGRDGRFATQGELPRDAERYQRLVVTREQVTNQTREPPKRPGEIVLQGDVKVG